VAMPICVQGPIRMIIRPRFAECCTGGIRSLVRMLSYGARRKGDAESFAAKSTTTTSATIAKSRCGCSTSFCAGKRK
jgi:hypothetical protein